MQISRKFHHIAIEPNVKWLERPLYQLVKLEKLWPQKDT
ncbi:hypothetical protein SLEP1_g56993 [Rubroshorea leprosula]|uniref:Uncharacterized protein n=1 Tax=Rubroshorea leprosula TaxID=152421 RepID=A0AAV5ML41_9ROSI|nr:hypothetical protein SLEP1_g56993 [Rubroshorea leprosula]